MSARTGSSIWRTAAELARSGSRAALATVARRRGSLPMASNAKILVESGGNRWGTVGGGCVEADVIAQALGTLETGHPTLVQHTLNADIAGDLGLSCGGTVQLFVEPVPPSAESGALLEAVADAVDRRRPVVVATALEWPHGPRKLVQVGDTVARVGDWDLELSGDAARARSAYVDEDAGAFVEPVQRTPRLIVFGAGHVGREIARVAAGTDFHVTVVDDRAEFANRERFPEAGEVLVADLRAAIDNLVIDGDDYIVSCTRGHAMDAVVVERTAGSDARYVGMLGSKRKQAVIWKALEGAGVSRAALERVKVPIGDPIGADTPAEIAVSVMAELIRLRRLEPEPGEQRAE